MSFLKHLASFVSILLLFTACISKSPKSSLFAVETKSLRGDTVITSVAYCNNRILCLQGNGEILVLDTFLRKDPVITAQFANTHVDFLEDQRDSIFIVSGSKAFYLKNDFSLQPAKIEFDSTYGLPYYSDSSYSVYACSSGEWGGAVHFYQKQTQKHFVYPAKRVQQVFKFNGDYVVSNYLAHMSGYSDYLFIKEPLSLADITGKSVPCDLFHSLDIKKLEQNALRNVIDYNDTFIANTLVAFPWHNDLYAIYSTTKATILAKFQQQKLVVVETLLEHPIMFSSTKTHLFNNGAVTAYYATWSSDNGDGILRRYQRSGLIFIKEGRIAFVDSILP